MVSGTSALGIEDTFIDPPALPSPPTRAALFSCLLVLADRVPFIGRVPGDIRVRADGWTVYAPLATSIVLSVLLTVVLSPVAWARR